MDSSFDTESEVCRSSLTVSADKLYSALSSAFPEAEIERSDLSVKVTERSESGCAATVELCSRTYVTGTKFAEAAGLPSSCFEVTEKDGSFVFDCKGRGHLVGMSQYGAQALAKEGRSCEEILAHYFPNALLTDTSEAR